MNEDKIESFLEAIPPRRAWFSKSAMKAAGVSGEILIDGGDQYDIDDAIGFPMLGEIKKYLGIDDFQATMEEGGDDFTFEAFGTGFVMTYNYFSDNGPEPFFNGKTERVMVRIEIDTEYENDE